MNGYKAFYKGKSIEIWAFTSLEAQTKAAKIFKAKKAWEVAVVLCVHKDKLVTHNAAEF